MIVKSKKKEEAKKVGSKTVEPMTPLSDDAMTRLAKIMNDSPTIMKLHGTEWELHGLKPGVQWMIAEEACKIVNEERASMGDVIKEFAKNLPSVCRVITIALLNDKKRIREEYDNVYDTLMWGDYKIKDWATLLYEILSMIDVDFFFASTNVIKTVRNQTLMRKTTIAEQGLSIAEPNGDK